MQLSARSVASLLARIFGPSFYDDPRFGRGDLGRRSMIDLVAGPHPEPWREVALNPQPLPTKALRALALADAHIQEVLDLDRIGALLGEGVAERAQQRALRLVADLEELCPRWPHWPRHWPPPPPPPERHEEMTRTELFVFGMRFLAASELAEQGALRDGLGRLGEKALGLSLPADRIAA